MGNCRCRDTHTTHHTIYTSIYRAWPCWCYAHVIASVIVYVMLSMCSKLKFCTFPINDIIHPHGKCTRLCHTDRFYSSNVLPCASMYQQQYMKHNCHVLTTAHQYITIKNHWPQINLKIFYHRDSLDVLKIIYNFIRTSVHNCTCRLHP